MMHVCSRKNKSGGGVAIYVRDRLTNNMIEEITFAEEINKQ